MHFKRSLVKKKDCYWIETADKIVYSNDYDISEIEEVDVRMPCSGAESIDPESPYPIDPSMESDIVNEVIAFFMPNEKRGQDSVADNRRTPSSGSFDQVR